MSAQVGLASLLSFTSTRRLDKASQLDGWVHTSWGPHQGLGLQVGCSQALFHNMQVGFIFIAGGLRGGGGVPACWWMAVRAVNVAAVWICRHAGVCCDLYISLIDCYTVRQLKAPRRAVNIARRMVLHFG